MPLIQETIEKARPVPSELPAQYYRCSHLMSGVRLSFMRSVRMSFGRDVLSLALLIIFLCKIGSAQVNGIWDSTNNSCSCEGRFTISTWDDGSPVGTMTCPGFQSAIYNIVVDGDNIAFSVDQQVNRWSVTYDYKAKISGNSMNGTCTSEEVPSHTAPFTARRHTPN